MKPDTELAKLSRALAEQTAELEDCRHRCERLQRFFSLRPEELRRVGETEFAEVIEREKSVARAERLARQREAELERLIAQQHESARASTAEEQQALARHQAELDRLYQGKLEALEQRGAFLEHEQKDLSARQKSFDEYCGAERARLGGEFSQEKALLLQELDGWKQRAEDASVKAVEASKRADGAKHELERLSETKARLEQRIQMLEADRTALTERLEDWRRKASDLETVRQELKAERQRLETLDASIRAREKAADERGRQLDNDDSQRRAALEKLKDQMRAEIGELTRQYRPKGKENS
jgi:chromosome segregation ATPase